MTCSKMRLKCTISKPFTTKTNSKKTRTRSYDYRVKSRLRTYTALIQQNDIPLTCFQHPTRVTTIVVLTSAYFKYNLEFKKNWTFNLFYILHTMSHNKRAYD